MNVKAGIRKQIVRELAKHDCAINDIEQRLSMLEGIFAGIHYDYKRPPESTPENPGQNRKEAEYPESAPKNYDKDGRCLHCKAPSGHFIWCVKAESTPECKPRYTDKQLDALVEKIRESNRPTPETISIYRRVGERILSGRLSDADADELRRALGQGDKT